MGRLVSVVSGALLLLGLAFAFGVYTAAKRTPLFETLDEAKEIAKQAVRDPAGLLDPRPDHWVEPRRFAGDGVVVNRLADAGGDLVLLQGFFDGGLEIRLIRRDGEPVRRWPLHGPTLMEGVTHIRNVPSTEWHFDTHGAVALPDGSIVFNLDYVGLFKMNKCGEVVWRLAGPAHHSVDLNADGTFWVSGARSHFEGDPSPHPLFKPPFAEDILLKVSAEGEILEEVSLLESFVASGELGLLTLTGRAGPTLIPTVRYDFDQELFHLNDIEELPAALAGGFPSFEAGDLLISLRNRNLVMVLDHETRLIKWWHIGGWIRQHDPDWVAGGIISVFDNNRDETADGEVLGGSRIVEIDPETRALRVVYGDGEGERFHSTRRGKHQRLANGNLLVTDAEFGRAVEVDGGNRVVWEYVNGYDENHTARISEAAVYGAGYFEVQDWSCPGD